MQLYRSILASVFPALNVSFNLDVWEDICVFILLRNNLNILSSLKRLLCGYLSHYIRGLKPESPRFNFNNMEHEQDHRRWRYYRRLLDYQFEVHLFPLDYRIPGIVAFLWIIKVHTFI